MFKEQNGIPSCPDKAEKETKLKSRAAIKSALLLSGLMAGAPTAIEAKDIDISNQNQQETVADTTKENTNPRPEDYTLKTIGEINLFYLDEIKSCDPGVARKVIAAGIINDLTTDKSEYLATLNRINEFAAKRPDIADFRMQSINDPEYASLYKQFQIENNILNQTYNSILQNDEEAINQRLEECGASAEEREHIEKGPDLIMSAESIRRDILDHIGSEEYLKMLQIEFNCSSEEAKRHQEARLNNVNIVNYVFSSTDYLKLAKMPNLGYFCTNTNCITLPRNVNLLGIEEDNEVNLDLFNEVVRHEFWHAAVNGESGISIGARNLLTITRDQIDPSDSTFRIEYFGNPAERYVHLKMLEKELEDMGIWTKGQEFTRECSDKMLDAYRDGKLKNYNSREFIETIFKKENKDSFGNILNYRQLYVVFSRIFNSIAATEPKQTYYPPEWWDVQDKQA